MSNSEELARLIGETKAELFNLGPITLIFEPLSDFYSLSMALVFLNGAIYEPEELMGITHFVEHMAFKGTGDKDYLQLSKEMDLLGGNFNAFTTKEFVAFYGKVIYSNISKALDLLFEIAFSPSFPQEEIEKEKRVILEEIALAMDQPEELLVDMYYKTVYDGHPLSYPVIGTEETVMSFDRERLIEYHKANFTPSNLIISLGGRFSSDEAVNLIERYIRKYYGDISRAGRYERRDIEKPRFYYESRYRRHSVKEAYVIYGTEGVPQGSPDRFKWLLLDMILGGGSSSKLFIELREKRGLVYTIGTFHQSFSMAGTFGVSFVTNPKNLEEAIDAIKYVFAHPERISQEDLEIAKAQLLIGLALNYESSFTRTFSNLKSYLYLGRLQSPSEIMREIEGISLSEVRDLAYSLKEREYSLAVVSSENPLGLPEFRDVSS